MKATVQRAALIFGVVFMLVAILGFLTSRGNMEADPQMADKVLGLFPVNLLHNFVHLIFGIWGVAASNSFAGARAYGRIGGVVYLLLAVLGVVAPNGFGMVPLGGNDIWLHALLGIGLAAIGFTAKPVTETAV